MIGRSTSGERASADRALRTAGARALARLRDFVDWLRAVPASPGPIGVGPDLAALVALSLSGLMDPETAVLISLIDRDACDRL